MIKYKEFFLYEGKDRQNELYLLIFLNTTLSDSDPTEELEEELIQYYDGDAAISVDVIDGGYISVHSSNFKFDQTGVSNLVNTYTQLKTFLENKEYVDDVKVAVEVDEWFDSGDEEYNLDEVSIEEFLSNVEYAFFIRHNQ